LTHVVQQQAAPAIQRQPKDEDEAVTKAILSLDRVKASLMEPGANYGAILASLGGDDVAGAIRLAQIYRGW
jgi:hypothetical protein